MKTLYFIISLLTITTTTQAQSFAKICINPNLGDTTQNQTQLPAGIYLSREEIQLQNPSITCNYVRRGKKLWYSDPNTGEVIPLKSKDFFGYVEANRLYLADNLKKPTLESGSYIYYSRTTLKFGYSLLLNGFKLLPRFYFSEKELLLSVEDGKKMKASKSQLKKILKNEDPELFMVYKNEKLGLKSVRNYIQKFNTRHPLKAQL